MAARIERKLTKRVPVDLTKRGHERLMQLKLRRSSELGYVLSIGFVVEELIDREYALLSDDAEEETIGHLYASRD